MMLSRAAWAQAYNPAHPSVKAFANVALTGVEFPRSAEDSGRGGKNRNQTAAVHVSDLRGKGSGQRKQRSEGKGAQMRGRAVCGGGAGARWMQSDRAGAERNVADRAGRRADGGLSSRLC